MAYPVPPSMLRPCESLSSSKKRRLRDRRLAILRSNSASLAIKEQLVAGNCCDFNRTHLSCTVPIDVRLNNIEYMLLSLHSQFACWDSSRSFDEVGETDFSCQNTLSSPPGLQCEIPVYLPSFDHAAHARNVGFNDSSLPLQHNLFKIVA